MKDYVQEIISFQSRAVTTHRTPFRYFAKGSPGILYQQSEQGVKLRVDGAFYELSPFYVFGQTLRPVELIVEGDFRLIIFYLVPDALRSLFDLDPVRLVDDCIDIDLLGIEGSADVLDKLRQEPDLEAQAALMAHFIQHTVPGRQVNDSLQLALQHLEFDNASLNLSIISNALSMSQRTLQRLFRQYIGITPRTYARVRQFNKALKRMESGEFNLLTELAYDTKYADQAHFSRTFREFTGLTPREFLDAVHNPI